MISRIINCKVYFMIIDTTLITLIFTNNQVNKPSDISVSVKPLTHPRYFSNINCSSADGVWMHDVHNKVSRNWPNALCTHSNLAPQSCFTTPSRKAE